MILYDLSFSSPLQNIVFDEFLLQRAQSSGGEDVLRLWESPVLCVVPGLGSKLSEDVDVDACRRERIDIVRRSSGGGTVLQGKGCLNFSFICRKQRNPALNDLHQSYHVILDPVIAMLNDLGVRVRFQPVSDLAFVDNDKKISGNAQRRLRDVILHHGTILYDFDLSLIGRYLRIPMHTPEYREGRSHEEFVANITPSISEIREGFLKFFPISQVVQNLNSEESFSMQRLLKESSRRYQV